MSATNSSSSSSSPASVSAQTARSSTPQTESPNTNSPVRPPLSSLNLERDILEGLWSLFSVSSSRARSPSPAEDEEEGAESPSIPRRRPLTSLPIQAPFSQGLQKILISQEARLYGDEDISHLFAGFHISHRREKGRGADATGPPLSDVYALRKTSHNIFCDGNVFVDVLAGSHFQIDPNTAFAYTEDDAPAIFDKSIIHQTRDSLGLFSHFVGFSNYSPHSNERHTFTKVGSLNIDIAELKKLFRQRDQRGTQPLPASTGTVRTAQCSRGPPVYCQVYRMPEVGGLAGLSKTLGVVLAESRSCPRREVSNGRNLEIPWDEDGKVPPGLDDYYNKEYLLARISQAYTKMPLDIFLSARPNTNVIEASNSHENREGGRYPPLIMAIGTRATHEERILREAFACRRLDIVSVDRSSGVGKYRDHAHIQSMGSGQ
ncbi:hypothetical protein BDK51DRAFT_50701 [Blyttiomyces helicus]|uniref:Uncharacterized protein n=1 Tax=Blyttiomyces helicus TaxID=388810 RepID=A0A4P9VYC0_9FUNG|nr:hypothetical protein BDK51DRAFT_50701 [Blyttiomyces helicus]|eukprot:RKO84744.1 hypothetical protein BDK51DRAFT_50701 [Blyttiomyces helicus]